MIHLNFLLFYSYLFLFIVIYLLKKKHRSDFSKRCFFPFSFSMQNVI